MKNKFNWHASKSVYFKMSVVKFANSILYIGHTKSHIKISSFIIIVYNMYKVLQITCYKFAVLGARKWLLQILVNENSFGLGGGHCPRSLDYALINQFNSIQFNMFIIVTCLTENIHVHIT